MKIPIYGVVRCAPLARIEPATYGLEVRRSVLLSYRGVNKN